VSLAVCLLAYSMVVAVLGPPLVLSATRTGAAPRLGVTVWLALIGSVLLAWAGGAVLFVAQLADSWDHLGQVLVGCVAGLRLIVLGGYGRVVQAGLLALAALSVVALAMLGVRVVIALRRARRHTRAHALTALIAAGESPRGPGGALVIDSAQPAVYCLASRPHTIVITCAALEALGDHQLHAVMAHEQAHLRGRHHHLLAFTGALSKILPNPRLFTEGATDIARLLEMCADDAAARRHSRDTVADALIALTLPAPPATPVTAMAAAGVSVTQRVQRLVFPPNPTPARLGLTLILAGVLLSPLLTVGMTALAPMLCAV